MFYMLLNFWSSIQVRSEFGTHNVKTRIPPTLGTLICNPVIVSEMLEFVSTNQQACVSMWCSVWIDLAKQACELYLLTTPPHPLNMVNSVCKKKIAGDFMKLRKCNSTNQWATSEWVYSSFVYSLYHNILLKKRQLYHQTIGHGVVCICMLWMTNVCYGNGP